MGLGEGKLQTKTGYCWCQARGHLATGMGYTKTIVAYFGFVKL